MTSTCNFLTAFFDEMGDFCLFPHTEESQNLHDKVSEFTIEFQNIQFYIF